MNFTDKALEVLFWRMFGEGGTPESRRATVERNLGIMIRCAMQTGVGTPPLVRWVKRNLPEVASASSSGRPVDPEWAAPRLAQRLCSQMIEQTEAEPALAGSRETVVGL